VGSAHVRDCCLRVRVRVRVCCVHVEEGSNVAIMLKDVHEQLNEQVPCPRTPLSPLHIHLYIFIYSIIGGLARQVS
jgi:hypothetical protein